MLSFWTRDVYKSTQHRVFNNTAAPRYSCPFFCNLDFDAEVAPAALEPALAAAAAGCGEDAVAAASAGADAPPIKAGHYIMAKLGLMWKE
jgi:isopenicillin N synthase-like dioxygenase